MSSMIDLLASELEHGGPHVHFAGFILFILMGIGMFHLFFRGLIELLCRITRISRENWHRTFRFIPTLLGIQLGIQLTKHLLSIPDFLQNILDYHYHSVVIITVTYFCAHLVSLFLKSKLSQRTVRPLRRFSQHSSIWAYIWSASSLSSAPMEFPFPHCSRHSVPVVWLRLWPCRIRYPICSPALRHWSPNRCISAITSVWQAGKPAGSSI